MKFEDIKEGQYLFYTERSRNGNMDDNYADSLNLVVSKDGVLFPKCLCYAYYGGYKTGETLSREVELELESCFDENCWHLVDDFHKANYEEAVQYLRAKFPLNHTYEEIMSTLNHNTQLTKPIGINDLYLACKALPLNFENMDHRDIILGIVTQCHEMMRE